MIRIGRDIQYLPYAEFFLNKTSMIEHIEDIEPIEDIRDYIVCELPELERYILT